MIKKDTFDKEKFKKELESNVRMLFRRNLDEATTQQIYQAVAYSVKDDIIDNWIETHKAYENRTRKWFTTCPWSSLWEELLETT